MTKRKIARKNYFPSFHACCPMTLPSEKFYNQMAGPMKTGIDQKHKSTFYRKKTNF